MSLPKGELDSRIDRVKRIIDKYDLDFMFVYYDEYNVMNGRYLTGWCPSIERGAVVVSNYCEPFLIGGPEAAPFAQLESAIKETVSCIVFMVPEEEYPLAEILNFKSISEKYFSGRKIKRVGVVGMHSVPYQIYSQLAADLPEAALIDLTNEYERLRYVKSEWEIAQMKTACGIADKAFDALLSGVKEGSREYEAAAEAEYIVRKMGGDGLGYRTIVGTAERSIGIVPAYSDRIFQNGEAVMIGIAPRFNGYNATACSLEVVGGKFSDAQRKLRDDVCEAMRITREALKPGMTGVEIDSFPRKFLLSKGYGDYMPMPFVHNCGLCEFEKPFWGPSSRDVIQENQVICLDISLFGHPEIPGIRVETAYLTVKDGCIPMSTHMEGVFGIS
jgi:Xaa-Pro aminopeptidase